MAEPSIFSDTTRLWDDYRNLLDQGADYNAINDVDLTGSYYNNSFLNTYDSFASSIGEFTTSDLLGGEGQIGGGSIDFDEKRFRVPLKCF